MQRGRSAFSGLGDQMGLLQWVVLLLVGAAVFLLGGCSGSSNHTLRHYSTGVTEPGPGLPEFTFLGYVDDQLFIQYDSNTRELQPQVPWIKKVDEEDSEYWDRKTQLYQARESVFRVNLENLRNDYNQSRGFHIWQWMYGCELSQDGRKGGYNYFGYDGRDFVSFDKETLTWTAADEGAQRIQRKWEANLADKQYRKSYLEEECIEWLQRYLRYGKEFLLRKEPPVVQVTRKADSDGRETLLCQAYGFYPKEIDVNWQKDGEVWEEGTFHGVVLPNSDGTYYALLGIKIDPKNRDRYRCHVEHDSLTKPLDIAWKEPGSKMGLIIGCIMGAVVLLVVLAVGIWVYIKKCQDGYKAASKKHPDGYKAASRSDGGSNSSGKGSNPAI